MAQTAPASALADLVSLVEIVRKIAELGSTARAARVLGISLQSASVAWRSLEHAAGTRLLTRDGGVLRITAAGVAYLATVAPQARDVPTSSGSSTRLTIDVCASEFHSLLLPALPCFTAYHESLHLEIRATASELAAWPEGVVAAIRTGRRWTDRPRAEVIAAYPRVACAARTYLTAHGAPTCAAELGAHTVVRDLQEPGAGAEPTDEAVSGDTSHRRLTLATDDADAALAAATTGRAIAILPLSPAVRAQLARGGLVRVLPQMRFRALPIVMLRATAAPPELERFAGWLRALYASECLHADELLRRAPGRR